MPDILKSIIQLKFKKNNLKAFLFFLLFSSIIWLLVQFSKQYTEVLSVPITFENVPKDKLITKHRDSIKLRVKQSGFQIAWFKVFKPKIKVDLEQLPVKDSFMIYNFNAHRETLLKKLPIDFNNIELLANEIYIPFQARSTKKVRIIPKSKIQYAPGYASEEGPTLTPDSIKLSGPQSILDTTSIIYTTTIRKRDVEKNFEGNIALTGYNKALTPYHNKVHYSVEVEKFTQRSLKIPIQIINAPRNLEITLYPSSVEVTFNVSLKRYNQIQSLDFEVTCDYLELADHPKFFIPRLVKKPDAISNLSLAPQKVQYIIKQ